MKLQLPGARLAAVSFAVVDPAAQNSVVQISPSSTSPDFTDYEDNGYFFRTVPSDNLQAVVLADLAQEARTLDRLLTAAAGRSDTVRYGPA